MSPRSYASPPTAAVTAAVQRMWSVLGIKIRDARLARLWSVATLAENSAVSPDVIYLIESGQSISLEGLHRLSRALGLRLEVDLIDPRSRRDQPVRQVDPVHSAMGEFEARHLRPLGFPVGVDEPYQHYQFAGRADMVAWDLAKRALLRIENRTRNPDFQAAAGSYNAKRAYLAPALAERLGVSGWASETNVIAALWSAEMLHTIRLRPESFRSLCPYSPDAFEGWWLGNPPTSGRTSTLIVLDPAATARQPAYVGFDESMTARPRHRGYAEIAALVQR